MYINTRKETLYIYISSLIIQSLASITVYIIYTWEFYSKNVWRSWIHRFPRERERENLKQLCRRRRASHAILTFASSTKHLFLRLVVYIHCRRVKFAYKYIREEKSRRFREKRQMRIADDLYVVVVVVGPFIFYQFARRGSIERKYIMVGVRLMRELLRDVVLRSFFFCFVFRVPREFARFTRDCVCVWDALFWRKGINESTSDDDLWFWAIFCSRELKEKSMIRPRPIRRWCLSRLNISSGVYTKDHWDSA